MKCHYGVFCFLCVVVWPRFNIGKSGNQSAICDPPTRLVNLTGDVIIAGLIPVHAGNPLKLNEPGIMWAEAMVFAIKEINENRALLPGLTLGYDIRDSCNQVDIALAAALDFLPEKNNLTNSSCTCITNSTPVIAVVGGATSRISTTVSPVFSVDSIPQISYSSTSPTLSDKTRYRSFMRTIPSDIYQARAIADILEYFNWTYVSVVVSDDEYGRNGLVALRARLKEKHICVAVEDMFTTNSDMENIIRKLQKYGKSTVVVLWCERPKAANFLTVATNKLFNVTWIGTESWGDSNKILEAIDFEVIDGMLAVLPFLGRHPTFEEYLKSVTPETKGVRNPWLPEFWAQKCSAQNLSISNCSAQMNLSALDLPPNKYAHVMDAVYAIAHGLHNLSKANPNFTLDNGELMSGELIKHVRNVNFRARSGNGDFMFTDTGDPAFGAYLIKNLQGDKDSKKYVTIAEWDGEMVHNGLKFDRIKKKIQWNTGGTSIPLSRCSEECRPGFYFVKTSEECCWNCVRCPDGDFKDEVANTDCNHCPDGHVSNANRTGCVEIGDDFLKWNSALSVMILIFSFIGLVVIVFVIVVFRKYSKTAVVKASNRELSTIQLTCHGLIFLLPLLYTGRPSDVICNLRSYFFSILFTITTSIMFLKTDRIVRIFNSKSRLTRRSSLLSNKIQFVLVFMMACVPIAWTTAWIRIKPLVVTTERSTSGEDRFVVYCGTPAGTLHLIQLAYILLLALACTYEAYNARRLPESFNEAKFICFSMFGFVLLWLGYIPGYMDTVGSTKQFITCLFVLLTNFTTLGLIYGPKLNIILIHPQKNRHDAFRQATLNSCIQQVNRLSPVSTPQLSKSGEATLTKTTPQNTTFGEPVGKARSGSELTDISIESSREHVVHGTKPATNGISNPLRLSDESLELRNNLNDNIDEEKEKVPSLIVRGQPFDRPKDSGKAPKLREAVCV